jgi:hypothetical protein
MVIIHVDADDNTGCSDDRDTDTIENGKIVRVECTKHGINSILVRILSDITHLVVGLAVGFVVGVLIFERKKCDTI